MFKVIKKHTRIIYQIYLKLTIKTLEQCLALLLLTLKHVSFDCTVIIAEFKQTNVSWAWETTASMFSVIVGNILSYGLGNLQGYMFLSLFTQHKDTKG